MKALTPLILWLTCLWGCSDLGTTLDGEWISYDLPYGHISLPSELTPVQSVGGPPVNPEFAGVVNNQTLRVQFCIHDTLWQIGSMNYHEQSIMLHGRHAVLFHCLGVFHVYNSHFSTIIGMKAYFGPEGDPVVVLVEIQSPEAEDLARSILFTMRP